MKDLSAAATLHERGLSAIETALSAPRVSGERVAPPMPEAVLVSDSGGLGIVVALVFFLLLILALIWYTQPPPPPVLPPKLKQ